MIKEDKLFQSALRKLSYRNHSRSELETYLSRKIQTEDNALVDQTIQKLEQMDLINDNRFASEWARSRANKGKGDYLVKRELQQKGVDSQIIDSVLANIPEEIWFESAQLQLDKKSAKFNKLNQYQKKQKMKQYLFQRGFSSMIINTVIDDSGV